MSSLSNEQKNTIVIKGTGWSPSWGHIARESKIKTKKSGFKAHKHLIRRDLTFIRAEGLRRRPSDLAVARKLSSTVWSKVY